MSLSVRRYKAADATAWDAFVERSWNGTFLHTRRFLGYHRDRFADLSLVIEDGKERIVGVFPAARDPFVADRVVSHPGITYGGIVHAGALQGMRMLDAIQRICDIYGTEGMCALRYRVVPYIYHRVPASDDLYALFRIGAQRYRSDLASTIDIENRAKSAKSRREDLRRAVRNGVGIEEGAQFLKPFWAVLQESTLRRHGVKPVHSLEEIEHLHSLFPGNIRCVVAEAAGVIVAGLVIFRTSRVDHAQHSGCSPEGLRLHAVQLALEHCILSAAADGIRYFDFGTSNEREGTVLNESLHKFKSEFGAGGVAYEFYELSLA